MGSMLLNSIYQNYLTTYSPGRMSRYDTHKERELRDIYDSIVKLNKESPWYLPTNNQSAISYAVDLKEQARSLHNTIASLGGQEEEQLLVNKAAYSSDPDIASVSFLGGGSTDESEGENFTLEIRSLATSQENLGTFLGNQRVALQPGNYSFDVAINDVNYEFQFGIGDTESNKEIQERLQRLINNADIGMNATLVESGGRTALKINAQTTGLPAGQSFQFAISDHQTSQTAGAVEYFGLDYTSRPAANAQFVVNGEEHQSGSNHMVLGKHFDVKFHDVTLPDEPITIGLKTDVESYTDNVMHLVNGYNDFMKAASSYLEHQPRSKMLLQDMNRISALNRDSLESMGINIMQDGGLQVDQQLLTKTAQEAVEQDTPLDFLQNFASQILRKTDQVAINPMDYVDKKIVAYKNPGRSFFSPYVTSAYSGMMFSSYC
jgi:flagellar hook-associated protein 2